MIPASQAEVTRFLAELTGARPIETHISAVFAGKDVAWKLKKAVHLPYLDFSTVAARHTMLLRELALNRRTAPEIYRSVQAVLRQPDGTLGLSGSSPVAEGWPVLDWVLEMARIPQADFFDTMAAGHRLHDALLDELADCVSAFHETLPPSVSSQWAAAIGAIIEGNVAAATATNLPTAGIEAWHRAAVAALRGHQAWFERRAAQGLVRRAHGDLHLGNICLWLGHPMLIDALEFDESLATIDLGFDLAFLLMDLDRQAGRHAANRVFNRYVARTGDADLVCGLPLYIALRAMVRAHVRALAGDVAAMPDARGLLDAGRGALAKPARLVIAIGGLPGTGKSTLARLVAPLLQSAAGALILRSDEIRKRLWHVAPEVRLPPDAYTAEANTALDEALISMLRAALPDYPVIIDATCQDAGFRHAIMAAAQRSGVTFAGFWLEAPQHLLEQRIVARRGDASDATVAILHYAAQSATVPDTPWIKIDGGAADGGLAELTRRLPAGPA
ncbi:MAG: AAA family ATPase [Acidiphilium sp.]|nr:AAA family ATPase [Acidiphilium sp.]MDD4935211.1 AAA family ATPase [Acidiphilium sp.]